MSVYSQLKVLHFKTKLDSLRPSTTNTTAPIHIRLKPTNVCNHDCSYCAYRVSDLQLGQNMNIRDSIPKDKMIELINDFDEMGVKAVTFSGGGEPFVYRHITMAAQMLAERGIRFASLTNGALLRNDVAEVFAHHGTWIRVSMDGWDSNSYARYRKVKESEFSKVLMNIKNFRNLGGKCILGVCYIIDRDNASHVYEMASRVKDIGAHSIKLSPCIMGNSREENNAYHMPFYEMAREQCQRVIEELQDENFEVYDSYHLLKEKFQKSYQWCPSMQVRPVIGADLNVYSCQDKAYNTESGLIGSIKNQRFKTFWFSDREKFFKINPKTDCNHHCVMHHQNTTIFDYIETHNDHLYFV